MKFTKKRGISAIVLFLLIVFPFYIFYIGIGAYLKTPQVISEINSSGKMTLKLGDVPEDFQDALLKVEDPNFYSHNGIDLTTDGAGWTTITQGLVKIYFFDKFTKGVFNKLKQSIIAVVFNSRVDKRTQLEIFINSVYLGKTNGHEAVGFQDGAKTYFNKDFSELSKDEFLKLVAAVVAPDELNPAVNAGENEKRVNRIKKMLAGECRASGMSDIYYENCN